MLTTRSLPTLTGWITGPVARATGTPVYGLAPLLPVPRTCQVAPRSDVEANTGWYRPSLVVRNASVLVGALIHIRSVPPGMVALSQCQLSPRSSLVQTAVMPAYG